MSEIYQYDSETVFFAPDDSAIAGTVTAQYLSYCFQSNRTIKQHLTFCSKFGFYNRDSLTHSLSGSHGAEVEEERNSCRLLLRKSI
jgi:hypothetical protein